MKLTKKARILLFGVIGILVVFGLRFAYLNGYIPGIKPVASSVPKSATVPKGFEAAASRVEQAALPSSRPTRLGKPSVKVLLWAWNAQMGELFANGGPVTTQGSLMEKHGVKVELQRQDDAEKMKADLVAFAQELKSGNPQPTSGAHFVQIMGDGYAQFAVSVNPVLKKLGPEYTVKVIGSAGRSLGEDKFMGPSAWRDNPQSAKGGVCVGYLRDGDWNIAMKWLSDNGIKNNPDETTYDPDALNWIAANDYIDAVSKLIAGYSETRPVVRNGRKTGESKTIQGESVVTWTPGDVMAAEQLGGLVSILSTRENDGQMPNAIIGISKWCNDNRETVEEFLAAIFEGGDQVRNFPEALQQAGAISAKVYGEKDAAYWVKYYKGEAVKDRKGLLIDLGGSSVHNLADNLNLFGLSAGHANSFAATYSVFGDIVVNQYPRLVPSYPAFKEVSDTSFLEGVSRRYPVTAEAEAVTYNQSEAITQTVANRSWSINFQSGSATLTPEGLATVEQLAKELTINNLAVEIHGHTDNVGNSQFNLELSRKRAEAVKQALEAKYPATFPQGRLRVIAHGDSQPVADNSTDAGKAQNRRVQIVQGRT